MTSDLIDQPTIPDTVRDKLQNFRDIAADRNAAALRVSAERLELQNDRSNAQARLQEFRRQGLNDANMPLSQLIDEIKRRDEDLARVSARAEALAQAWQPAARLVAH